MEEEVSSSILSNEKGKKVILLGNEAIVRGALESGIGFASTYPGTPASEVGDTFSAIAKKVGIYFEYSTNEKVALEAAMGASFSGVRSIVSMKQFGVNVAADSLMPFAYVGPNAGTVIIVADDPGCWSSAQSEQDTRYYAKMAHIPMLEPSDPQECKDFVKFAFDLSEKFKIPVFLRTTTRVSHERGVVRLDNLMYGKTKGFFQKDMKKFNIIPPNTMRMHEELLEKMEKIRQISERTRMNYIVNENVKSKLGIITSGVSFNYVMEALIDLNIKLPILKLSLTYPLPEEKIKKFMKKFKSVLVVEELEPILEEEILALAKNVNPSLRVYGKKNDFLPKVGEYDEEIVISALMRITGRELGISFATHLKKYRKVKIPRRFAVMCPGCPHRATFWAAKIAAGKNTIFGGDIGCYVLGIFPPYYIQDFVFSMGASEGVIHGIEKVTDQKVIAFIGDSTFFHAGIPGLINTVFNKSKPLIIVMDNRTTAMTGHQPHPGVGKTGMSERSKEIKIEKIVKACEVKHVKVVDPYKVNKMIKTIRKFLEKDEVSVIVAKRECRLLTMRRKSRADEKIYKYEINQNKCKRCGTCLFFFACPAVYEKDGVFYIDKNLCTGCGVCKQVCPHKAIRKVKKK
ncbi:MAG: indolepyruvate ferredoxin oxidoreductase subunit alpha [Candidatus Aenigmarchaeota archaeon]|nr:indolepyruvate ferredoxin oxidoreductase subunit alpha [Candidatus Aenigmarchaeota archaeon]